MRLYEMMSIFPLDDGKFNEGLEKTKSLFQEMGVTVVEEKLFADRELCYEVNRQNKGRFYLWTLKLDPGILKELDRKLKLSACMLRFMFVKLEDKVE